jgi:hypothetical protein
MSDPINSPNPTDEARAEALAWLAGQFRWEALLADLHELAEKEAAPVVALGHKLGRAQSEDAA